MASRTVLRATETLLINSNKVRLYNYSAPLSPHRYRTSKRNKQGAAIFSIS